jgi:hypothetical protein
MRAVVTVCALLHEWEPSGTERGTDMSDKSSTFETKSKQVASEKE